LLYATVSDDEKTVNKKGANWNQTFERLVAYKNEYGNCNVPQSYNDGGSPHLGRWVSQERQNYKKGHLSQDRIDQLESIGFVWRLEGEDLSQLLRDDKTWESAFQRLVMYKDQHGDVNVPNRYKDGGSPHLGRWVQKQKDDYLSFTRTNGGTVGISQERFDRLNSIGIVWELGRQDEYNASWMAKFGELKSFQQKYNSTKAKSVARASDDPISKLGYWVAFQIVDYNKFIANETSRFTEEKIELLESMGFSWTLKSENAHDKWLHMYFKLYLYHYQNNSTKVSEANGHNSKLVNWAKKQKEDYKNSCLSKLQIDLLNELDFDWTLDPSPTWDDMYNELVNYHTNHGSTLVPSRINRSLAKWTQQQRKDCLKGRLHGDKVEKLERLEFDWKPEDIDWNAMFDRLVNFKQKFSSTLVPRIYGEDPPLENFVRTQRYTYGKNLSNIDEYDDELLWSIADELKSGIPSETHFARMKKLIDLEFVWDVPEAKWMKMYEKLVKYKEMHNNTLVSEGYSQDPDLGTWVITQRHHYVSGRISARRIVLLNDIDFVWDPHDYKWNEMFDKLVLYREKHGSAMVPCRYKDDPELAYWVLRQRRSNAEKRKSLSEERINRLDSIGFVWSFR
jgi:hypothetical protein